ncbi:MAG: hypothetical protein AAF204_00690 [Pseudomonadota bacterium]
MFGFRKNKKQKSNTDKRGKKKTQKLQKGCSEGNPKGIKSESQRIREEALANARAARENIGEDTIQKIAAAMAKKQNSPMERARAQLANADSDKIADEIMFLLDDK